MAQLAPIEAATPHPHRAESLPIKLFTWIVIRSLRATALTKVSSLTPSFSAAAITGKVAVNPWFPLPAVLITGSVHPSILASTPAAVNPMA